MRAGAMTCALTGGGVGFGAAICGAGFGFMTKYAAAAPPRTTRATTAAIRPIRLFFGDGSPNAGVIVIGVGTTGAVLAASAYAATLTFASFSRSAASVSISFFIRLLR